MLETVLLEHQSVFQQLAEQWQTQGAIQIAIVQGGKPVWHHPPHAAAPTQADLSTQILPDIELWIIGTEGETAQARLKFDAYLLEKWLRGETELEEMVQALMEVQDQMFALYELNQAIRSQLNTQNTLDIITEQATRLLASPGCFVLLQVPDGDTLFAQQPAGLYAQEDVEKLLANVQKKGAEILQAQDDKSITHLFVCPLHFLDDIVGVFGSSFDTPAKQLSPKLKLLRIIAEQTEAHIENAIYHEQSVEQAKVARELELARDIQARLLPQQIPVVEGLEIFAHARPARAVGGDLYDFLSTPTTPIFIVGDLAGKGMPAALMMATTRRLLHSLSNLVALDSLTHLFDLASQALYDDLTNVGSFVTVFATQYHPDSQTITCINAGHSPVIYCPANDAARMLEADGPVMGVLHNNLSQHFDLPFGPGDLLLIGTDGLSEAMNPAGEMFGYTSLIEFTKRHAHLPVNEIGKKLNQVIDEFTKGALQSDDQTFILLKGIPR